MTSLVQVIAGDKDGALETQRQCFSNLGNVANAIPYIGHAKGAVHLLCADVERALKAFAAANRTSFVMVFGVVAFRLLADMTGDDYLGLIIAVMATGAAHDAIHSIIVNKARSIFAAIKSVAKADKKAESSLTSY